VLTVLVRVGGGGRTKADDTEGARDCHIDSQTLTATPDGDGDVTRAAARRLSEDTLLLKHGAQKALLTHPLNKVPDPVVPHDEISVPLAATGVIAKNVKGLLAKRAGELNRDNRETQTVGDRGPEDLRAHDRLVTVLGRGDGRDKGAGVWLEKAIEALATAPISTLHQGPVDNLIDGEGRLLLGPEKIESGGGDDPSLARSAL